MTAQIIDFQSVVAERGRGRQGAGPALEEFHGIHLDAEVGYTEFGSTKQQTVIFKKAFVVRPSVTVHGSQGGVYFMNVTSVGFSLDRVPTEPVIWAAALVNR